MHGILVALPSGIMFALFWAVKQFHVYCLIFSGNAPAGVKTLKKQPKNRNSQGPPGNPAGAIPAISSRFNCSSFASAGCGRPIAPGATQTAQLRPK
jgi:hypothetical protein